MMPQADGEPNFFLLAAVALWIITIKCMQNIMRIFWVSQDKENCIMGKNGTKIP